MKKLFFILTMFFAAITAFAQTPGALDLTFGGTGKVVTPVGSGDDYSNGVAIQTDGKIVAVGNSNNGSNTVFTLARYNANGSLDNTFGTSGKVLTSVGSYNCYAYAIAIQTDGKIVIVGIASTNGIDWDFAVVRYNPNGILDNTFGTNGEVITPIGSADDNVTTITIQTDGKIVVAGYSKNGTYFDFAVVRYNVNGTLDNTFGTSGKVITPVGSTDDYASDIAIQTNGKIVASGYSKNGTYFDFAVVRYNINGTLDNTFGTNGKVITSIGSIDDYATAIAIQSDGKIVASGYSQNGSYNDFAIVRYTSVGILDNTFGTNGKVVTSIASYDDYANALSLQNDGKIIVGGGTSNGSYFDFALARYNTNGTLDNTFGTSGKVMTSFGNFDDDAYAITIQTDGKIVASGYSNNGSNNDFALARYYGGGPVITDQSVSEAVCLGADVILHVSATGDAPLVYQWKKNGTNIGALNDTLILTNFTIADTGHYTCYISNSLGYITSNACILTVSYNSPVSIIISASLSGAICTGTSVTFTATPTNGGTSPIYQWKINGLDVGANSSTFNSSTLVNGDTVTCVLTSSINLPCITGNPATSNKIIMAVSSSLSVGASITAYPSGAIYSGANVTFTAATINGGVSPTYQWKINNSNVGTNSSTFSSTTLANSDIVKCVYTSSLTCATGNPATSNIITMSVSSSAQQTYHKTYGGTGQDYGRSIITTYDGGFAIIGNSNSFSLGGDDDIYLLKTDIIGNVLMEKTYGGTGTEACRGIIQLPDNGFVIFGTSNSFSASNDMYLIRTDEYGDTLWTKTYGGSNDEAGRSIYLTSDGGFILVGTTNSFGSGNYDVYLIKTNSSGNVIWAQTYGGLYEDYGYSVQQTNDHGYIIAGATKSFGSGNFDSYLIKTDSIGNQIWYRTFGGTGNDAAYSVLSISDGYILGGYNYTFDYIGYVKKTDLNGNSLWTTNVSGSGLNSYCYSIIPVTDGYFASGTDEDYFCSSHNGSGAGGFMSKLSTSGSIIWSKSYGGVGNENIIGLTAASDNGYTMVGSSDMFGNSNQIYIIKTDSNGCAPFAYAGSDIAFCGAGNSAQLIGIASANCNSAYSWSPAAGLDNPTYFNPIATPAATTNYIFTSTDACGITLSDTILISVGSYPTTQGTLFTSSLLTDTSMTIGWVRGNGTSVLVVAHQGGAVNTDPISGTSYTANPAFGSGTQIGTGNYVVYNGAGTSVNLTALTEGTTYYYAVYEYDTVSNCYLSPALTGNAATTGMCIPAVSVNACGYMWITDVTTSGGVSNFSNSTGCAGTSYTDYSGSHIASNSQLANNTMSFTSYDYPMSFSVWIDYNDNGTFEPTEWVIANNNSLQSLTFTDNFTVPISATPGTHRMRVRGEYYNYGAPTDPCNQMDYGETEDYSFTVIAAIPCTGTPNPGNTLSTYSSVCPLVDFTLSLQNNVSGIGITYQWQSSVDNITWTDISGATNATLTTSQTVSTYYRCSVICSAGPSTGISSSTYIIMNGFAACYCNIGLGGGCYSAGISAFSITNTTLDNQNTYCDNLSADNYSVYPATTNTTANLQQSVNYTFNVTTGADGYSITSVWIDFDQNGIFNDYEWTQVAISTPQNQIASVNITIPANATLGQTGMRVRSRAAGNINGAIDACTYFGSGSSQDYIINITSACAPPIAPSVGPITQPTCTLSTGSVFLYGLPSSGNWTLTMTPGNITTNGTGTGTLISGLAAGTYIFEVTSTSGCTSAASANIVINAQPATPVAPSIGPITQPTCLLPTGSVFMYDLPASGTWTLTRTPGGIATNGAGTGTTISGLAQGTYTFTVTNASGCTSTASDSVDINTDLIPTAEAGPTVTYYGTPVQIGDAGNGPGTINWLPAAGLSSPTIGNPTASPAATTTYTITVNNNGCVRTDMVTVVYGISGHIIAGKTRYLKKASAGNPVPNLPTYNAVSYNINNVEVILKTSPGGAVVATAMSNANGVYQFTNVPDGNYILSYDHIPYDTMQYVNQVNAVDLALLKYLIGHDTLTDPSRSFTAKHKKAANVDNNASINTVDIARISSKVGLPYTPSRNFPKGNWVALDTSVAVAGADLTVTLQTVAYGDYDASSARYKDSLTNWGLAKVLPDENIIIRSDESIVINNPEYFEVPLRISTKMNELSAVGLELSYPSNNYKLVSASMSNTGKNSGAIKINPTMEEIIAANNDLLVTDDQGIIRVVYATTDHFDIAANDELVRLGFRSLNDPGRGELDFKLSGTGLIANQFGEINEDAYLTMPKIFVQGDDMEAGFEFAGYPNPFRDAATLTYSIPENGTVKLNVYNAIGELVSELVNETQISGKHSVVFSTGNLSEGMYTFKLEFNGVDKSKCMVLKLIH